MRATTIAQRHGISCSARRAQDRRAASQQCMAVHPDRRTLLSGVILIPLLQQSQAHADEAELPSSVPVEDLQPAEPQSRAAFREFSDDILAYQFEYPTITDAGRPLSVLLVRRPERYSSAAPLTADARQRTVAELADLAQGVVASVSVGPPAGLLAGKTPEQWSAATVAEQVLIDRSTARVTSGQRVSLNSVEAAAAEARGGETYWVYEHVSQGSPTSRSARKETYRHSLAVTAARPGLGGAPYLYTLTLTCPQELWAELEGPFKRSVASFALLPPGPNYVAPDQEPWRFWG